MVLRLAIALWAFAEATLFFVVPDVLLSYVTVARSWRRAARLLPWAVVGALLGGLAIYHWGQWDSQGALAVIEGLPAISEAMVAGVRADLAAQGLAPLFWAGVTGVPYKIFAATAADLNIALGPFLLASAVARALRFCLAVALAALCDRLLARWLERPYRLRLLAVLWLVFYGFYWGLMPG